MLNYFRRNLDIVSILRCMQILVEHNASIEILMVLKRKMLSQFYASSHCLLQMTYLFSFFYGAS